MPTAAPWLAHYDPNVPATLAPYPDRTLVDYLADAARTQPDKPALLFKGATMTYGELERASDACAAAFAALGIRRGDRVGLLLPNCPQFFIARVRRLEARRDRRAAQPDLHGARARRADSRARHRNARHADALLPARQARPAAHRPAPRRRHEHQGALSADPPRAVHAAPRKARRRPHHARTGRLRFRAAAAREPRPPPRARRAHGRRSRRPADERRHDRHAERRRRHARRATSSPACRSGDGTKRR